MTPSSPWLHQLSLLMSKCCAAIAQKIDVEIRALVVAKLSHEIPGRPANRGQGLHVLPEVRRDG